MAALISVLLSALAAEAPCGEAIPEFAAYETLLRSDDYFPITDSPAPTIPMVFSATDAWEPVYVNARSRIDALAALAASRRGCEIERLGCFQRLLSAHTAMLAIKRGGGNSTLLQPSFIEFRTKTLRWGMANFLWLIETCEKEVAKAKSSTAGPVVYPLKP